MQPKDYYTHHFSFDVSRMPLRPGSPFARYLLLQDAHATFFGGHRWHSFEHDLRDIPPAQRLPFLCYLFCMDLTGDTLYRFFPEHYPLYRSYTRFPLFGEEEAGALVLEAPLWVLLRPLEAGWVSSSRLLASLEDCLVGFGEEFDCFSRTYLEGLSWQTLLTTYCRTATIPPEALPWYPRLRAILLGSC